MATLVMQLLGCDVAALNTVHFSESFVHALPTRPETDEIPNRQPHWLQAIQGHEGNSRTDY